MRMKIRRKIKLRNIAAATVLLAFLLSFFAILNGQMYAFANDGLSEEYRADVYSAKVIQIVDEQSVQGTLIQSVKIRIQNRDLKNTEVIVTRTISGNQSALKKGDRIIVRLESNIDNNPVFYFHGYDRSVSLALLCIFFIACVLLMGGLKGLKALIALAITVAFVFFGLVPLLLKGWNPILLSVVTAFFATVATIGICFGLGKKGLSAVLGISGGLLIGGIIAYLFGIFAKITGISSGDAQMLQYLPNGDKFDFKGLLFAGIIIGALGACMDVAVSISSALTELRDNVPDISSKELMRSGFNIGKDIMGSMVNTLILAYTGSALASILIFVGFEKGFNEIINLESISTEIIRAITGSLGLLFAIPLTIFAFILLNRKKSAKTASTEAAVREEVSTEEMEDAPVQIKDNGEKNEN